MKKRFVSLVLCFVLVFGLSSCGAPASNSDTRTVIDMSGAEVTIPAEIERVLCGTIPVLDMIYAFGAEDTIIGAHKTFYSNPWVEIFEDRVDEMYQLQSYEEESESLLAQDIDIYFLADPSVCESLRKEGVPAVCVRTYNLEEVKQAASLIGEIYGGDVKEKSEKWLRELDEASDYVESNLENISYEDRPVVYEIIGQTYKGLFRTDYDEAQGWLKLGGGQPATAQFKNITYNNWPTEESILATNPEVVFIDGIYWEQLEKDLYADERWAIVDAVKNKEVYFVPTGCTAWSNYGAGYVLMIYYVFHTLYPNLADFSMKEKATAFYQEFYNIDLTEQQVENMLNGFGPDGASLCPTIE